MAKRQRTKHPAPVLFGRRLTRVWSDPCGGSVWSARFGWLLVSVEQCLPSDCYAGEVRWDVSALGSSILDGTAGTVDGAAKRVEAVLRQVGSALPAAALVSRREWRITNG